MSTLVLERPASEIPVYGRAILAAEKGKLQQQLVRLLATQRQNRYELDAELTAEIEELHRRINDVKTLESLWDQGKKQEYLAALAQYIDKYGKLK